MKKILAILLMLAFFGGLYGWFFVYNKPHTDFEQIKPDYTLPAKQLFSDYFNGKGKVYTGKVLEISGIARKADISDTLVTVIFVFNEGMFGDEGIRCSFKPKFNQQLSQKDYPSQITLKGFCSGFNDTDVIMEHCSLVN